MPTKNKKIRTRMAPSPTGALHIGGLRTALYNYLFAKQNGGEFFLRIEDTDRTRFVKGATEQLQEMLRWAGLQWDTPHPQTPSPTGRGGSPESIWIQSERLDIYKKYAQQLVDEGRAYYCFCTPERLAQMREEQQKQKQSPGYDGCCKKLSVAEAKEKLNSVQPHVLRFQTPKDETIELVDAVYGHITVNSSELDDQVLLKSDGYPTYHLAVVVDDHEMGITHIMRGEEWLPSTPKHILLYQAFGWEPPAFIHLPNILGENRKKLSKRTGDVSVEEFKDKGYLPEALLNYLALLGWNPGTEQEIFSLEELVRQFDVKKIHRQGAVFDYKKLDNINGQYIRKLETKKLVDLCRPYLDDEIKQYGEDYVSKVVEIEQERLKKLEDIKEIKDIFFADELNYDTELLIWKQGSNPSSPDGFGVAREKLIETKKLIETIEIKEFNRNNLEKEVFGFIADKHYSNGEVLWPLRAALSGQKNSPGPFEIMDVLGQEESVKRVVNAITKLS